MIKIKYVGVKADGERAFQHDTGIEWFPGDVHEVKEEHAANMLRHPDVFEQVAGKAVKLADAPKLKGVAASDLDADDEAIQREEAAKKTAQAAEAAKAVQKATPKATAAKAADPLEGMDDAAVRAFAKAQGLKIKGIGLLKGKTLHAKVKDALGAAK